MSTNLIADMRRLRDAVRAVRIAAMAESKALEEALPVSSAQSPGELRLHITHLDELDAIQSMFTSMELIERLYSHLFDEALPRQVSQ